MKSMRIEFSKVTKLQAWRRCHDEYGMPRCEADWEGSCGHQPFSDRRPQYDHDKPCAMGGNNSLFNCRVLCPKCHRAKTSTDDMPVIWKSTRVREKRGDLRRKGFMPYRLFDGTPIWKRP